MIFHDSRDARFRSPGGARPCGDLVCLSVRAEGAKSATLRLWKDGREWKIPMARSHQDLELFSCEAALPEDSGNLWYYFIVEMPERTVYYGNARDLLYGEGEIYAHEPPSYQITLYDPAYEIPGWMREGTMLQILPDRFCRKGDPDPAALHKGAYYHEHWRDWPDLNLELDALERSANDFFGGNLAGIREKLPYIESLGVTAIYLNPVFRSPSNHKYDTGDYMRIDPSFGTEEDFRALSDDARARGMRILLDGVFSHTGADSLYFNKYGTYGASSGAYRDPRSPYRSWFRFEQWPEKYDSWWGFQTLPNVNELDPSFRAFINGPGGVVEHWLRAGAGGWRLDVADELPMPFLRELRARAKETDPEAAILGEVWEDPTNKVSYGEARCYCAGDTLDSAMNYPLRDAIFAFLLGRIDAHALARRIEAMREAMPKPFFYSMMNLLGSHDKPRAINVLADCGNMQPERRYRYPLELTPEQYALGKERLITAWELLFALPGMPSLYYGDEAGLTGMADPFCRRTYPWGDEDQELISAFRSLSLARRESQALRTGEMRIYAQSADELVIERTIEGGLDAFHNPAPDEKAVRIVDRRGTGRRKGLVFSIQPFCVDDGPGIRTCVYLKGCILRCAWCHNPESIAPHPETSYIEGKCAHCGRCATVCAAHTMEDGKHLFNRGLCDCGGEDARVCPTGALSVIGERMSVDAVLAKVERDRRYFKRSGGGLTVTGGDPLAQPEFTLALLKRAKARGLNTAIETCGAGPYDNLRALLPVCDTFLFDYKMTDDQKHLEYTGRPRAEILQNLERLAADGARIALRCPIIPGVNDDPQHFAAIAALTQRLPLLGFELMPYHDLGLFKCDRLGKERQPRFATPAADAADRWREAILRLGGREWRRGL